MATQQNLKVLSQNIEQLKAMQEELDQDIARAAIACVKAGDATLMQQLVGSVSHDHEFSPLLLQLALEMRSATANTVAVVDDAVSKREMVSRIVNDAAVAYTDTLEIEALELSAFLRITLQFVPAASLPDLAGAVLKHILSQQAEGIIGAVPESDLERLDRIQAGKSV